MARRAAFNQADITRALKGAEAAGVKVAIKISPDGTFLILPANDHLFEDARSDLDSRLDAFGAS